MFQGPVEEVWQCLHMQINLPGAAKIGAQEGEGKTSSGTYKGKQSTSDVLRGYATNVWGGARAKPCHGISANNKQ